MASGVALHFHLAAFAAICLTFSSSTAVTFYETLSLCVLQCVTTPDSLC